jgi:hypothetical protein
MKSEQKQKDIYVFARSIDRSVISAAWWLKVEGQTLRMRSESH